MGIKTGAGAHFFIKLSYHCLIISYLTPLSSYLILHYLILAYLILSRLILLQQLPAVLMAAEDGD